MDGNYTVCAIDNNALVGIAGIHTYNGSLTGGIDAKYLVKTLGLLKGLRATAVFMLTVSHAP